MYGGDRLKGTAGFYPNKQQELQALKVARESETGDKEGIANRKSIRL